MCNLHLLLRPNTPTYPGTLHTNTVNLHLHPNTPTHTGTLHTNTVNLHRHLRHYLEVVHRPFALLPVHPLLPEPLLVYLAPHRLGVLAQAQRKTRFQVESAATLFSIKL